MKNKNILKKIFKNLQRRTVLDISKYNKKLQNRLNITLDDYKEYCQIEIDAIPEEHSYGKFINIVKEKKRFFHIYFNDNKEEIKRNYLTKSDEIKKIKIIVDYQVKSFGKLYL